MPNKCKSGVPVPRPNVKASPPSMATQIQYFCLSAPRSSALMLLFALFLMWQPAAGTLRFIYGNGNEYNLRGPFYLSEAAKGRLFASLIVKNEKTTTTLRTKFSLDAYCDNLFYLRQYNWAGTSLSYAHVYLRKYVWKRQNFHCVVTAEANGENATAKFYVDHHPFIATCSFDVNSPIGTPCAFLGLGVCDWTLSLPHYLDALPFGRCGLIVSRKFRSPKGCGNVTVAKGGYEYASRNLEYTRPFALYRTTIVVNITGVKNGPACIEQKLRFTHGNGATHNVHNRILWDLDQWPRRFTILILHKTKHWRRVKFSLDPICDLTFEAKDYHLEEFSYAFMFVKKSIRPFKTARHFSCVITAKNDGANATANFDVNTTPE